MNEFTLTITIDEYGRSATALVKGIKGPACATLTDPLQELGKVEEHLHTEEWDAREIAVGRRETERTLTVGR